VGTPLKALFLQGFPLSRRGESGKHGFCTRPNALSAGLVECWRGRTGATSRRV
jgi:hypothetical protein